MENAGHTWMPVTRHLSRSSGTLKRVSRKTLRGRNLMRGLCMIRRASRLPRSNCHCPLRDAFAMPATPLQQRRTWVCDQMGRLRLDVDPRFWSQVHVHPSCALGGDDKVLLHATEFWRVIGHTEGQPEFVQCLLKFGIIDVAFDPQFARFTFDLSVRPHLPNQKARFYEIPGRIGQMKQPHLDWNGRVPVDPFRGHMVDKVDVFSLEIWHYDTGDALQRAGMARKKRLSRGVRS